MLKKFLMKQAMKSQLKGVSEADQERILDMVERNPEFFENMAKEIQDAVASGKDQQTAALEIMTRHRDMLGKMMQK